MAVSMTEAWNELPSYDEPTEPPPPAVAARRSTHPEYPHPHPAPAPAPAREPASPPPALPAETPRSDETVVTLTHILAELQEMRSEQVKRSAAYLVFAGILFSILIYYIDKVSTRTRHLDHTLLRTRMAAY